MASNNNPNIPKCQVQITETCAQNGDLQIAMYFGPNLNYIEVETTDPLNQYPFAGQGIPNCCETPGFGCTNPQGFVLTPNPTTSTGWDDFTITAYCDLNDSIANAVSWDGGGAAPAWADPNGCGVSTLASDTAIYFFYDTTSLDDQEQSIAYVAANQWVANMRATGNYTGKAYHCEVFGERWILWPAWIFDHSINASGTDTHGNACNGGTGSQCAGGTMWIYPQGTNTTSYTHWTNDSTPSLGPGQTGTTLPTSAEGPTANVLCVIFADEAEGVPMSNYDADPANQTAMTGDWGPDSLTAGTYPEFGNTQNSASGNGYHYKVSSANSSTAQTWAAAAPVSGGADLTDLWKYDVLRAKTIISNHQSTGTVKTYVYPATTTASDNQRTFGLHILGAITTGTMAAGTAPTASGTPSTAGNPTTDYTKLGDMSIIESSNPYSSLESGRFGNLDQLDFGYSIESNGFDSWRFEQDLEAFLLSGTGTQCDNTDCVKVQVVDSVSGTAISGHVISIHGNDYTTDAQGYTPLVTGLSAGAINIGPCATLSLSQSCRQWLVTLKLFSYTHTPTTICTYGCTDNTTVNGCGLGCNGALNYDPLATIDDGSCIYCVYGCTNPLSLNYNPAATCDDGSCQVMPDTAECLLKDISKQLLEDCTDLCETNPKIEKLRSDLQYAESLLAQFYQMYKCDTEGGSSVTHEAYDKVFAAFRKLFTEYKCENCGEYHPDQSSISTGGGTSTNPADCDVDFGGNCTSLIADPGQDVVSAVTSTDGGSTFTSMGAPPNIVNLGNVVGKTVKEKHLCYDNLAEVLDACGLSNIDIDTKVYCFYDGTSLGQNEVKEAYTAVMDWLTDHSDFTPVLRDPSQQRYYNNLDASDTFQAFSYGTTAGENVFHTIVAGERWLDWAIVPITGQFNNSVDVSGEPTYNTNRGGAVGNVYGGTTGGTNHAAGFGHKAADVAGYSYKGPTGPVTGKINHWVGYGNNLAGTSSGTPSDSNSSGVPWADYVTNFASITGGAHTREISMSKPDGTNFNNASQNLRCSALFPIFGPTQSKSVQAINWSFIQWRDSIAMTLPESNTTIIPVQMYDTATYDDTTQSGPRGHSVYTYNSASWPAPNTWVKLAEEGTTAIANASADYTARSRANCVHLGPPPGANKNTDNVLVLMFADESNAAYHGRSGSADPTFIDTFYSSHPKILKDENPYWDSGASATAGFPNFVTSGIQDSRIVQPTYSYKLDYLEYVARRASYISAAGKSYRAFLYPSKPTNTSAPHMALPLQGVAAIANGNKLPADGVWLAGTTPCKTSQDPTADWSTASPYPDPITGDRDRCSYANLLSLELENPYWDTTTHPIPANNPQATIWGGLEDHGFGTNSQCRDFDYEIFKTDLEIFLGTGGTACSGVNCIGFQIVDEYGDVVPGQAFNVNGTAYTTDSNGEILHNDHPALEALTGTVTFGFDGAETWSYVLPEDCSMLKFTFIFGQSTYDVCVTYPEVACGCDSGSGSITINTGTNTPADTNGDTIIGTITNETTEVVTNILESYITGTSPNVKVVTPFTTTSTSDIPDGRYTLILESVGGSEWKECRLILCDATRRLQNLFKNNISNIKCDVCGKVNKDFVTAYTLWRALKITGWDPEYAAYIDTNITELQAALTAAESGNCKCC